jgi:hypothetical protein
MLGSECANVMKLVWAKGLHSSSDCHGLPLFLLGPEVTTQTKSAIGNYSVLGCEAVLFGIYAVSISRVNRSCRLLRNILIYLPNYFVTSHKTVILIFCHILIR